MKTNQRPADDFERHGLAFMRRITSTSDGSRDDEFLAFLRRPPLIVGTDEEYDFARDEQLAEGQRPRTEEEASRG